MKKNRIVFLLLIIFSFCFINNVKAIELFLGFNSVDSFQSIKCDSDWCARALLGSEGVRVSVVSSTGVQKTQPYDLWPNDRINPNTPSSIEDYLYNTYSSCSMNKYYFNHNYYNTTFNFGIESNAGSSFYRQYFQNFNSTKFNNIIRAIGAENVYSETDYLKIEPIYVVKENYFGTCRYYYGTSLEIINSMASTDNEEIDGKKRQYSAWNIINGGGYSPNYVFTPWNEIRNHIVSMYYTGSNGPSNVPTFPSSSVPRLTDYYRSEINENETENGRVNGVPELINLYRNGNGLGVGYIRVSDYIDICQSRANANRGNSTELIKLYQEYLGKGHDYRNLLNFNNPTCTIKKDNECNWNSTIGCFSGQAGYLHNIDVNNTNDFSCYNDTINYTNSSGVPSKGYCYTTLDIKNKIGSNSFTTKSGQLLFDLSKRQTIYDKNMGYDDTVDYRNAIASLSVRKVCVAPNTNSLPEQDAVNFFSNNGIIMKYKFDYDREDQFKSVSFKQGENYLKFSKISNNIFSSSFSTAVLYSNVWAEKGTGKIYYSSINAGKPKNCSNCIFIGSGIPSNLNLNDNGNDKNGKIIFYYYFKTSEKTYGSSDGLVGTCNYKVTPEIVKDDNLNLEFRIIDTNNPFPGKNGSGRRVGSNWCNLNFDSNNLSDINGDGKIDSIDVTIINRFVAWNPGKYDSKMDINGDGKVNKQDVNLYMEKMAKYSNLKDCSHTNKYAISVVDITNNSYDKNKTGPIYTIKLGTSEIRSIRKYNESTSYDDYTLKCDDENNCKSTFLETYGIKRN